MRVAVVGGRDFNDSALVRSVLDELDFDLLISGGARGADTLGEQYAIEKGIETLIFHADWDTHGPKAGPIRNTQIIKEGKPDLVIAFYPGKGTNDTIRKAIAAGIEVHTYAGFGMMSKINASN